jgi:hypothetical protein
LDRLGDRRLYRDEAGVEPVPAEAIPRNSGLDDRWNASGFIQREGTPGHVRMAISPDRSYVITATGFGSALIWEAPGGP